MGPMCSHSCWHCGTWAHPPPPCLLPPLPLPPLAASSLSSCPSCSPVVATTLTRGAWWNSALEFIRQSSSDIPILTASFTCLTKQLEKLPLTLIENSACIPPADNVCTKHSLHSSACRQPCALLHVCIHSCQTHHNNMFFFQPSGTSHKPLHILLRFSHIFHHQFHRGSKHPGHTFHSWVAPTWEFFSFSSSSKDEGDTDEEQQEGDQEDQGELLLQVGQPAGLAAIFNFIQPVGRVSSLSCKTRMRLFPRAGWKSDSSGQH